MTLRKTVNIDKTDPASLKQTDISKIDPNLSVKTFSENGFDFYDPTRPPFRVYGLLLPKGEEPYRRIPKEVAENCNEGVAALYTNTAGGRLRFCTDASIIMIRAKLSGLGKMPHFAFTGSIGFDLYADGLYAGTFTPPFYIQDGYTSSVDLRGSNALGDTFLNNEETGQPQAVSADALRFHEILIHFPLYTNVVSMEIGLPSGSTVLPAKDYCLPDPIVYYGSSITQGGCAARPGNSYEAMLSRWLDVDHVNLGFSGSGRGESAMAKYIATLPMAAFVMDYDHNAPTPEHLERTHFPMYEAVRKQQPTVPILMVTRPKPVLKEEEKERFAIIRNSYERAKAQGDVNIYFIDGTKLFLDIDMKERYGENKRQTENTYLPGVVDDCTVDGSHPTDLGFYFMAKNLLTVLKEVL